MSQNFIPFPARPPAAANFVPFPSASTLSRAATTGQGTVTAPSPAAPPPACATPQVAVVRDGDRVTAIRVTCACGEVIELECET